jgi:hypothetical protein
MSSLGNYMGNKSWDEYKRESIRLNRKRMIKRIFKL